MPFTESQAEFLAVATVCNVNWVPYDSTLGNPLPVHAVIGGHLNDIPLYVARKLAQHVPGQQAKYSYGYYDSMDGLGHFPYIDIVYNQVEILVVQEWNVLGHTDQLWS